MKCSNRETELQKGWSRWIYRTKHEHINWRTSRKIRRFINITGNFRYIEKYEKWQRPRFEWLFSRILQSVLETVWSFCIKVIKLWIYNWWTVTNAKIDIITCIPKDNKTKIFLKNLRPLTLLDTVYKLASGSTANRIKTVLDLIINIDQTGFIKGRSIVENIRVIYDIMNFTDEQHIPGLLLFIDFEKAFDSLAWNFLYKALEHLNFSESLRQWVRVFYKNISSAVIQSGHLSSLFSIQLFHHICL